MALFFTYEVLNYKCSRNAHVTLFSIQRQPPDVFIKKAVLNNFPIFAGKHLCWSLFLIKLQDFRPATILKVDFNTVVFL